MLIHDLVASEKQDTKSTEVGRKAQVLVAHLPMMSPNHSHLVLNKQMVH